MAQTRERIPYSERFTYGDFLACFDVLRNHTGARPLIYLASLVGTVVMEGDILAKLKHLVRKGRAVQQGRGLDATYRRVDPTTGGDLVQLKKAKSSLPWDGRWNVLNYDIPTSNNTTRRRLARLFRRMGFTCLSGSSWLAPYDWLDELRGIVSDLGCPGRFSYVRSAEVMPLLGREEDCSGALWPLEAVAARYAGIAERCVATPKERSPEAGRWRARACVGALKELAAVEEEDPMLPAQLLPSGWPRPRAIKNIDQLTARVRREAEQATERAPVAS